ncbi:MAG: hypothetical protein ABW034_18495 [Steroidobacteraceae bacterium]
MQDKFRYAQGLTLADNENHPPGTSPLWQESSVFYFSDPGKGVTAFHRIGILFNREIANIYSWTSIGGKVVSRAKRTRLPIPTGPTTGTSLDGLTFTTLDPLIEYRIQVDRDGVETDVVFKAFTGPVTMDADAGGLRVAARHYNMLAQVTGTVRAGGSTTPIDGVGFIDHSWGPRDLTSVIGHRFFMCVFDENNYVSAAPQVGVAGRGMVGYLRFDGELSMVTDVQSVLYLGDDNLRLEGCRASITDRLGRKIVLKGTTVGEYNVQPLGHGYFAVQHGCLYDSDDGRRGRGVLEWGPARMIPDSHREALGLRADDFWLTGADPAG